jgi:hypothetical protein
VGPRLQRSEEYTDHVDKNTLQDGLEEWSQHQGSVGATSISNEERIIGKLAGGSHPMKRPGEACAWAVESIVDSEYEWRTGGRRRGKEKRCQRAIGY